MLEPEKHIFWERLAIIAGIFLVIESLLSINFSLDQRDISNYGRYIRLIIGLITIIVDYTFLKSFTKDSTYK